MGPDKQPPATVLAVDGYRTPARIKVAFDDGVETSFDAYLVSPLPRTLRPAIWPNEPAQRWTAVGVIFTAIGVVVATVALFATSGSGTRKTKGDSHGRAASPTLSSSTASPTPPPFDLVGSMLVLDRAVDHPRFTTKLEADSTEPLRFRLTERNKLPTATPPLELVMYYTHL